MRLLPDGQFRLRVSSPVVDHRAADGTRGCPRALGGLVVDRVVRLAVCRHAQTVAARFGVGRRSSPSSWRPACCRGRSGRTTGRGCPSARCLGMTDRARPGQEDGRLSVDIEGQPDAECGDQALQDAGEDLRTLRRGCLGGTCRASRRRVPASLRWPWPHEGPSRAPYRASPSIFSPGAWPCPTKRHPRRPRSEPAQADAFGVAAAPSPGNRRVGRKGSGHQHVVDRLVVHHEVTRQAGKAGGLIELEVPGAQRIGAVAGRAERHVEVPGHHDTLELRAEIRPLAGLSLEIVGVDGPAAGLLRAVAELAHCPRAPPWHRPQCRHPAPRRRRRSSHGLTGRRPRP